MNGKLICSCYFIQSSKHRDVRQIFNIYMLRTLNSLYWSENWYYTPFTFDLPQNSISMLSINFYTGIIPKLSIMSLWDETQISYLGISTLTKQNISPKEAKFVKQPYLQSAIFIVDAEGDISFICIQGWNYWNLSFYEFKGTIMITAECILLSFSEE